ncbi:EipA family protein [Sphingobium sp. BYY-5]|uniref:EipA family protein n=1 Tax=Sphingobium sp. BYY-5 TaxID=2926400 RepID=UPI001FA80A34|nr:EipA family protein [Sphingobium sp. BYY-5]MCI4590847.1 EipA family protein [Sphingobium sp. BYY-5]
MVSINGRMSVRIARAAALAAALAGMALTPVATLAQVRTVDPNTAIDADLAPPPPANSAPTDPGVDASVNRESGTTYSPPPSGAEPSSSGTTASGAPVTSASPPAAMAPGDSYQQDDLIGAAEGVFGKGAEGLAGIIEKILKDQGRPNAYISGREASGAFVVGLRYGSGTLNHKIEGKREVYWTGPSIGFDVGGNASNTFVLVYNLYDTQDLYHRFPAAEGTAYLVGGFTASYLRWGNVVLIPIRLGVGYRLGVNAGYMKFTEKRNWLPF